MGTEPLRNRSVAPAQGGCNLGQGPFKIIATDGRTRSSTYKGGCGRASPLKVYEVECIRLRM